MPDYSPSDSPLFRESYDGGINTKIFHPPRA
jgi:hypothetical protein